MAAKCKICTKSVYPMDPQINLDGVLLHKPCAKCADCKCQITLTNFSKHETPEGFLLLCKTHYFKRFREEGSYLGGDKFQVKATRDVLVEERRASLNLGGGINPVTGEVLPKRGQANEAPKTVFEKVEEEVAESENNAETNTNTVEEQPPQETAAETNQTETSDATDNQAESSTENVTEEQQQTEEVVTEN